MWVVSSLLPLFPCFALAAAAVFRAPTNILHLPTNTSSPLPFQSQHSGLDRITYLVPNTATLIDLLIYTDLPINSIDVEVVLSAIEVQLNNHIDQRGDGPLTPEDNPYDYGIPGCWCSIGSASKESLSYSTVRNTIVGLQTLLVEEKRFFVAYWDVSEGEIGGRFLGDGSLEDHRPGWEHRRD